MLSGDREAVARVAVELKTLGVELGAIAAADRACSVSAMVVTEREGLSVAVQDASRRSEGRVVGDAKVAAAWIDSWLRDAIEVASWTVDSASPAVAPPPVASPALATPVAAPATSTAYALAPTPSVSPFERAGLSVSIERSWTDDDTTWNGFDISGCVRAGIACLGGRVRAGFQDDLAYNSTTADRSDLVALATVSIPLALGQVSVSPELGLGVGRARTTRVETCQAPSTPPMGSPGCSDPMDPNCVPDPTVGTGPCTDAAGNPTDKLYVGDGYDRITYLPRAAVALRFAFPIVQHVWLDAVAAYTLTPFSSTGTTADTPVMSPNTGNAAVDMPPEASRGYQLGVGIRVGMP